jgi:hypothetical protein
VLSPFTFTLEPSPPTGNMKDPVPTLNSVDFQVIGRKEYSLTSSSAVDWSDCSTLNPQGHDPTAKTAKTQMRHGDAVDYA